MITLHTCGIIMGRVVKKKERERERDRTVNKLAFKQDNLGFRVLDAKKNTATES